MRNLIALFKFFNEQHTYIRNPMNLNEVHK